MQLSLADFVKGYTKIEADLQVQPATTIRGAAGLEWNTRPGRYLQAGSELSISLRVAVPLSQMKGVADVDAKWLWCAPFFGIIFTQHLHLLLPAITAMLCCSIRQRPPPQGVQQDHLPYGLQGTRHPKCSCSSDLTESHDRFSMICHLTSPAAQDVDLFLKIEKAVRACNIVTLNLLPPPSEESDDQGTRTAPSGASHMCLQAIA